MKGARIKHNVLNHDKNYLVLYFYQFLLSSHLDKLNIINEHLNIILHASSVSYLQDKNPFYERKTKS